MRQIELRTNDRYTKCPRCGNNTKFKAHSSQVSEDCCEVWVVCVCGFDPTSKEFGLRYEDTWGGTDDGNVMMALDCWNDAIYSE